MPPGERLLVTAGAGGVGHFAVQLGARRGLEVVTTAGPANHEFVRGLGASEVIDYHRPDATNRVAGISYVLDAVGGDNIGAYQGVLAEGARIVAVAGLPPRSGTTSRPPPFGVGPAPRTWASWPACSPTVTCPLLSRRCSRWPRRLTPTFCSRAVTSGASW